MEEEYFEDKDVDNGDDNDGDNIDDNDDDHDNDKDDGNDKIMSLILQEESSAMEPVNVAVTDYSSLRC